MLTHYFNGNESVVIEIMSIEQYFSRYHWEQRFTNLFLWFFILSEENKRLKQDLKGVPTTAQDDWKAQCLSLQDQVVQYQEKLSKKQDAFAQLQKEKDEMEKDLG